MNLEININTNIIMDITTNPVMCAVKNLQRDIKKVCIPTDQEGCTIQLIETSITKEEYRLIGNSSENKLYLYAGDDLGFIYGIYEISRSILGIPNFWFWNDYQFFQRASYSIDADYHLKSKPFIVLFRGWFINDEVLIHSWSVNRRREGPWEMIFETLLRCGGNMVIPGTDKSAREYRSLASQMGLYITHHHAEPLGAEMFSRAYPNLSPSYKIYPNKFKELWRQGIEAQKHFKVIWNLGFRGQGDCPFWYDDPSYKTPEERGKLMSQLIGLQYEIVKEILPDAICCTNLYGETMELYQDNYLKLPADVIKIWADNGFGKMVTRRQGNHNPRIASMPSKDDYGMHGIYYHVSFYDLQAANHITMLQNSPEFIYQELKEVMQHDITSYWLVNCSNVKPHVYWLDFISEIWRTGTLDIEKHRNQYVRSYYGRQHEAAISNCLSDYHKYAVSYGTHEDEHAGEQFTNHVARILISQYMKSAHVRSDYLCWATDAEDLRGQIQWFEKLCVQGKGNYEEYLHKCEIVGISLKEGSALFKDSILLQAQIHYYCYLGAEWVCSSLMAALDGNYQVAFYYAGKARESYLTANHKLRLSEHGKWIGFYKNECLTDIKQSGLILEGLMSYIRNLDDGPYYYKWKRDFLYSDEDKQVMLLLVMENHLSDLELFTLMKEKWE